MTVPGKGGRPRKWRSDADRVRAYRARQTGIDEPPTLVQALDEGDELARVWAMVRDLGEKLDTANTTIKDLRRERDQAHRDLEREQRRWGWIETTHNGLAAERDRLASELNAAVIEQLELRERLARHTTPASSPPTPAPAAGGLSRAQRRQLEREQARRHKQ
jgi:chromosome segregation ATPase